MRQKEEAYFHIADVLQCGCVMQLPMSSIVAEERSSYVVVELPFFFFPLCFTGQQVQPEISQVHAPLFT